MITPTQRKALDRMPLGLWTTAYATGTALSMMETLRQKKLVEYRRLYVGDRLVHEFKKTAL